jgi:60 kDa SS-A/Ro ribonucleoprotein
MVPNSAGGYAFAADDWMRLDRFLILGAEGGTYYIGERELTKENAKAVLRCIEADGTRTVDRIVEVSKGGLAVKNDPALFALALAASLPRVTSVRQYAMSRLPDVARTGTHLYHFVRYCVAFRGWGRGLRSAVAGWFNGRGAADVAYQAVKYQQRDGWSARDLLRLAHVKPATPAHNALYRWITKGAVEEGCPAIVSAFEAAKVTRGTELLDLISGARLTREMLPTEVLKDPDVWEVMLPHEPLHAIVRNLANLTRIGYFKNRPDRLQNVLARILDPEAIRRSRLHPLAVLQAERTYEHGESGFMQRGHVAAHQARRGDLQARTWEPLPQIVDALDQAFYIAFDAVEPTGKRICVAVDASRSMDAPISGMLMSCREAAIALALTIVSTEPGSVTLGFTTKVRSVAISPRQRLTDAMRLFEQCVVSEGTDASLPFVWAAHEGAKFDAFVILTDSETWAGVGHPVQALEAYRKATGIPSKLVVIGMVSNGFTIADPSDPGQLDVVGFDTSVPQALSAFLKA